MKKLIIFLVLIAFSCGNDESINGDIKIEKNDAPPGCLSDYQNSFIVNEPFWSRSDYQYDYLKDNSTYFWVIGVPEIGPDHVNAVVVMKLLISPGISFVEINGAKYYSPYPQYNPDCGYLCSGIIWLRIYPQYQNTYGAFPVIIKTGNVSGSASVGLAAWFFVVDECNEDEVDFIHSDGAFYEHQFIQVEE